MDVRRGALIALVACAACTAAGAEPAGGAAGSGTAPAMPAAWKPLPVMATAAAVAARAEGVTVDAADAWGDPAVGCYAVQLALHGGTAAAPAIAEQLIDGAALPFVDGTALPSGSAARPKPGSADARISVTELTRSADSDALGFAFTRPPYRGRVRARLGAGRITALACFGNQRDPARCDAACGRMLQTPS